MNIEDVHEMGIELESWLRLRLHAVAIKMLKKGEQVPEGSVTPTRDWGHKYAMCQAIARVQRRGETVVMRKEDHWCPEPVIGLGLAERVPFFLEGWHRYPDSVKTLEAGAAWCRNMPCLEYGKYSGSVCAPVGTCRFIPDVIVFHVNGMMMSQLLNVRNWVDGKDIVCQLSGHAGCVYAIALPLLEHDCQIAVPCKGDRRYAGAQDEEMLFSLVAKMLPDFVHGCRWLQDHGWSVPHIQDYKEEYDLKLSYKKLAESVGMDVRQSPQRLQVFRDI